jgi:hypothetical protein
MSLSQQESPSNDFIETNGRNSSLVGSKHSGWLLACGQEDLHVSRLKCLMNRLPRTNLWDKWWSTQGNCHWKGKGARAQINTGTVRILKCIQYKFEENTVSDTQAESYGIYKPETNPWKWENTDLNHWFISYNFPSQVRRANQKSQYTSHI